MNRERFEAITVSHGGKLEGERIIVFIKFFGYSSNLLLIMVPTYKEAAAATVWFRETSVLSSQTKRCMPSRARVGRDTRCEQRQRNPLEARRLQPHQHSCPLACSSKEHTSTAVEKTQDEIRDGSGSSISEEQRFSRSLDRLTSFDWPGTTAAATSLPRSFGDAEVRAAITRADPVVPITTPPTKQVPHTADQKMSVRILFRCAAVLLWIGEVLDDDDV